jgi:hypothetical protein
MSSMQSFYILERRNGKETRLGYNVGYLKDGNAVIRGRKNFILKGSFEIRFIFVSVFI